MGTLRGHPPIPGGPSAGSGGLRPAYPSLQAISSRRVNALSLGEEATLTSRGFHPHGPVLLELKQSCRQSAFDQGPQPDLGCDLLLSQDLGKPRVRPSPTNHGSTRTEVVPKEIYDIL